MFKKKRSLERKNKSGKTIQIIKKTKINKVDQIQNIEVES